MQHIDIRRVRRLNTSAYTTGPILYWMSRDQRIEDNWALLYAQELARQHHTFVIIVFCIRKSFEFSSLRLVDFMFEGLKETEKSASTYHIPFFVILGETLKELLWFIRSYSIGAVISDMNPLRWSKEWKRKLSKHVHIPFMEIDAHNIVPVWETSDKQEYAAYTIRPKINAKLSEFLTEFPQVQKQTGVKVNSKSTDWIHISESIVLKYNVPKVSYIHSGSSQGITSLNIFISKKLKLYEKHKNDPSLNGQSQLSPYIHFGQLSSQRIALSIRSKDSDEKFSTSFLEELIVRKELSENFCWYNESYDSTDSFPTWSKKTLEDHVNDRRYHIYDLEAFERANTHDSLWNAAQNELTMTGKMHGYMRMYWAKKILEWTHTSEEALRICIHLNDLYSLDGRDPNGYAGIAWSIGGVHDRPWFTRPIFGMVRYMSDTSLLKKYDCSEYIRTYSHT